MSTLTLGSGPERAGDDRALRVLLGLLLGEPALAAELLDQRVVLGQPLELAVAEEVGAAVADVAERDLVVADHRRGQRRAHPRARGVLLRRARGSRVLAFWAISSSCPSAGLLGASDVRARRRPRRSARRPRRPGRRPCRRRPRTPARGRSRSPRWRCAGGRCRSCAPASATISIRQTSKRNSVSPIRITSPRAELRLAVELARVEQGAVGRVHVLDEVVAASG